MNINYVIIGSDENPYYLEFWPIVSKVWKEIFNITPVLGLISDVDSEIEETEYGLIKKFKKIDNINVGLQSQIVRLYLPKFLNGYCLISDIDMLPLSKEYFKESCKDLINENLIVLSSDNPECLRQKMYPMCYVAAHSNLFNEIFDLNLSWEEFTIMLNKRNESWYTDQKYLYEKINEYNEKTNKCVFLNRGWSGAAHKRIDRIRWIYDKSKVKDGHYIDSHLLRPYNQYVNEINELVNLLY